MAKDELLKQLKGLKSSIGKREREEEERALREATDKEMNATYYIKEKTILRVREVAKETKQPIKRIVQTALDNYLKQYD